MKKVWIASILSTIMLMVPITSVIGASDKVNDCGYQPVNRVDLLKVRLLLIRIEAFTNVILSRFGHMPEVKEKCEEILDGLNTDILPYSEFWCIILWPIIQAWLVIAIIILSLIEKFEEKGLDILYRFYFFIYKDIIDPIGWILNDLITYYECL